MNKGNQPSGDGQKLAEAVEQRDSAEGNTREAPTAGTQGPGKVSRGLEGVREAARRDKLKRELRRRFQRPVPETGRWLRQVLQGYYRYFAVPYTGAANYPPLAQRTFSPPSPEAGAVCGNSARTDLYGGCLVRGIPTVT